jgi:hypothetical protein
MKNMLSVVIGLASLMPFMPPTVHADVNAAANKAREGIAEFKNRDFKAALKAFDEAESDAPDDLRLAFDRGCAYAAAGDVEKAIDQFRKSAAAEDNKLAALSEYNLGCVAAGRATAKLGGKPEEAEGDVRTQALAMIADAASHFRDTVSIDSRDEDARYNLETLRAWSRYIQAVWKQRDRERQRDKLNLLDYLQLLETEQRMLREKAKQFQAVVQDSPRKRQEIRVTAQAQQELAGEVGSLKAKIDELVAGQGRGPGAQAVLPRDATKAVEVLKSLVDEIVASMQAAVDRLSANSPSDAISPQTSAIENLDQVFSAVAPYVNLVQRGISREEELLGDKSAQPAEKTANADLAEAAWNQRFIERYGKIILFKAKQELRQLEAQSAAATPPRAASDDSQPKAEDSRNDDAVKADEQRRELKESLQLGVELAPKVEQLAREAADLLSQEKAADALPKQQEALKLLKEMLPKQQQQEQQKKDQEKKDKKDQEKEEQNKKGEQKKDQEKKDQEKKAQEKKEQEKKEQDQKQPEKVDQQKQEKDKNNNQNKESAAKPGQKQDMPPERAEELLRRVQSRQEQHKQMEKELQEYLYRPEKVEKDW